MTVVTIRLPEKLLHDLDASAHTMHIQRAEYIRLAIIHMNNAIKQKQHIKQLQKASLRVRKQSMQINKEFSKIEHNPEN